MTDLSRIGLPRARIRLEGTWRFPSSGKAQRAPPVPPPGPQIAAAALAMRLPTVYGYREHVIAGGLISYGVDLRWCYHRPAHFVDKILHGAAPGDLPIEFPTQFPLSINLKQRKSWASPCRLRCSPAPTR